MNSSYVGFEAEGIYFVIQSDAYTIQTMDLWTLDAYTNCRNAMVDLCLNVSASPTYFIHANYNNREVQIIHKPALDPCGGV